MGREDEVSFQWWIENIKLVQRKKFRKFIGNGIDVITIFMLNF